MNLDYKPTRNEMMPTFTVTVLPAFGTADGVRLSVKITEEAAPLVHADDCDRCHFFDEGVEHEYQRDYGNANWPTDEQIAAEATRQLGYPVAVHFKDTADSIDEAIYRVERIE